MLLKLMRSLATARAAVATALVGVMVFGASLVATSTLATSGLVANAVAAPPAKVVRPGPKTPAPKAPISRFVNPAGQPVAGSGGAPTQPPVTVLTVSKQVQDYAGLLGTRAVAILSAKREEQFFRIEYRVGAQDSGRAVLFVTLDGKYASPHLVDIAQRTTFLRSERSVTECLIAKGLRVFVVPGEAKSDEQIAAMGPFGDRVLVNCGGGHKVNCAALGYKSFPVLVWTTGSLIGLKGRAPLLADVGCK